MLPPLKTSLLKIKSPGSLTSAIPQIREYTKDLLRLSEDDLCDRLKDSKGAPMAILQFSRFLKLFSRVIIDNDAFLHACGEGETIKPLDQMLDWANGACAIESKVGDGKLKWTNMNISDRRALSRVYSAFSLQKKIGFMLSATKSNKSLSERLVALFGLDKKRDLRFTDLSHPMLYAAIHGACPLSQEVSLIRWNGDIYMTSTSFSGKIVSVPIPGEPFKWVSEIIVGDSAILDYTYMNDLTDATMSLYATNQHPIGPLTTLYQTLMQTKMSNNDRVGLSKFTMSYIDMFTDCVNDPEIYSANEMVISGLFESKPHVAFGPYLISEVRAREMLVSDQFIPTNDFEKFVKGMYAELEKSDEGLAIIQSLKSWDKYRAIAFYSDDLTIGKYIARTMHNKLVDANMDIELVNSFRLNHFFKHVTTMKCLPKTAPDPEHGSEHYNHHWATLRSAGIAYLEGRLDDVEFKRRLQTKYFSGVEIFDTVSGFSEIDVTSYIRDNGAVKSKSPTMGKETTKEISIYCARASNSDIRNVHSELRHSDVLPEPSMTSVSTQEEYTAAIGDNLPVKLMVKEKEKKIDARSFGIGEFDAKIGIAKLNKACMMCMGAIPNQFMTISDKEKVNLTHQFGDMLNDPDALSIMLDISGHNQSFAPSTMKRLLRAVVCAVKGFDEENWGHLFRNLACIYNYPNGEKSVIIKNQWTGIEGWFGYLWGMHTALVVDMFLHSYGITKLGGSCYGDDVNMIIKLDPHVHQIKNILHLLVKHFENFGQVIKLDQTAVSRIRLVLLKNTYIKHYPVDISPKRTQRISPILDWLLCSDGALIDNIQSGESSSYEISSSHKFPHFLARVYAAFVIIRFMSGFFTHIPGKIIWNSEGDEQVFERRAETSEMVTFDDMGSWFKEMIASLPSNTRLKSMTLEEQIGMLQDVQNIMKDAYNHFSPMESTVTNLELTIYRNVDLREYAYYLLYAPRSIGGFGFLTMLQLSCPGSSAILTKGFLNLKAIGLKWLNRGMHVFKRFCPTTTDIEKEKSLVADEFPSAVKFVSALGVVTSFVVSELQKPWVRNSDLKESLKKLKDVPRVMRNLVAINRKGFSYRIVSAMFKLGAHTHIEAMIRKISTSSGIFSMKADLPYIRAQLQYMDLNAVRLLTYCTPDRAPPTNEVIAQSLMSIKEACFVRFNFHPHTEPSTFDNLFEVPHSGDVIASINPATYVDDAGKHIVKPDRTSVVREKFSRNLLEDDELITKSVDALYMKCKWILTRSLIDGGGITRLGLDSIVQTCAEVLATWGLKFSKAALLAAAESLGGEILHRIAYIGQKDTSTNHLEFLFSGSIKILIKASFLALTGGENSNVNFKQMENELCGRIQLYGGFVKEFKLKPNHIMMSVQGSFIQEATWLSDPKIEEFDGSELFESPLVDSIAKALVQAYSSDDRKVKISEYELNQRYDSIIRNIPMLHDLSLDDLKDRIVEVAESDVCFVDDKKFSNELRIITQLESWKTVKGKMQSLTHPDLFTAQDALLLVQFINAALKKDIWASSDPLNSLLEAVNFLSNLVLSTDKTSLSELKNHLKASLADSGDAHRNRIIFYAAYVLRQKFQVDTLLASNTISECERLSVLQPVQRIDKSSHALSRLIQDAMANPPALDELIVRSYECALTPRVCGAVTTLRSHIELAQLMNGKKEFTRGCRSGASSDFWALVNILHTSEKETLRTCNLTGGRGEVIETNEWLKRQNEKHLTDLCSITRAENYTTVFKSKFVRKERFALQEPDDIQRINKMFDVIYIELSYLQAATSVGSCVSNLEVLGGIFVRPGASLNNFVKGLQQNGSFLSCILHVWDGKTTGGIMIELKTEEVKEEFNTDWLKPLGRFVRLEPKGLGTFDNLLTSSMLSISAIYDHIVSFFSRKLMKYMIQSKNIPELKVFWEKSKSIGHAITSMSNNRKIMMNWYDMLAFLAINNLNVNEMFECRSRDALRLSPIEHHAWVCATFVRHTCETSWLGFLGLVSIKGHGDLNPIRRAVCDTFWHPNGEWPRDQTTFHKLLNILNICQGQIIPSGDFERFFIELNKFNRKAMEKVSLADRSIEVHEEVWLPPKYKAEVGKNRGAAKVTEAWVDGEYTETLDFGIDIGDILSIQLKGPTAPITRVVETPGLVTGESDLILDMFCALGEWKAPDIDTEDEEEELSEVEYD